MLISKVIFNEEVFCNVTSALEIRKAGTKAAKSFFAVNKHQGESSNG
jgi:hypothetical protein